MISCQLCQSLMVFLSAYPLCHPLFQLAQSLAACECPNHPGPELVVAWGVEGFAFHISACVVSNNFCFHAVVPFPFCRACWFLTLIGHHNSPYGMASFSSALIHLAGSAFHDPQRSCLWLSSDGRPDSTVLGDQLLGVSASHKYVPLRHLPICPSKGSSP